MRKGATVAGSYEVDAVDAALAAVTGRMPDPEEPEGEEVEPPHRPTATRMTNQIRDILFRNRILIISGEVTQKLAAEVMGQLLAMSAQSDAMITIFINSQGGHVESGDTIHDVVRYIPAPVRMMGTGWVASAGALIYVAVPREQRFSLPNTRYLLHQPAGGTRGTASDVEIEAREILKMRERLNRVFAEQTGQELKRIEDDTRRNFWLGAKEAIEYGLVGRIVQKASELPAAG
jgi:ATP-dependent Clp protease, protease subunit